MPADLLKQHGAVSEPVALAMAEGARKSARADVAVSITGIAGPTGGTPEKPVGLVFIGVSTAKAKEARRFQLEGSRDDIRRLSAGKALAMLLAAAKDL